MHYSGEELPPYCRYDSFQLWLDFDTVIVSQIVSQILKKTKSLFPSMYVCQKNQVGDNLQLKMMFMKLIEHCHEKTCLRDLRPGQTQIGLYDHKKGLEA